MIMFCARKNNVYDANICPQQLSIFLAWALALVLPAPHDISCPVGVGAVYNPVSNGRKKRRLDSTTSSIKSFLFLPFLIYIR